MEAINVGVLTFVIVAVIAVGILIYTYTPAGKMWTGER